MANIVGLFCIGPNPAACLVRDGRLVAMAEEERFRRNKDIELHLPLQAMHYCLDEGGIGIGDIDTIAYGWDTSVYRGRVVVDKARQWLTHARLSDARHIPIDELRARLLYSVLEIAFHHPSVIRKTLSGHWETIAHDLAVPEVRFIPHHLAHAAATYYTSGLEEATVLVMDRNGETTCSSIWRGEELGISLVEKYELPHSLGWFYAGFTDYLGFIPEYQEGKVMGLAAHGRPDESLASKLRKVLDIRSDGSYALDPTYFYYGPGRGYAYTRKLCDLFGPPRREGNDADIPSYYKNVACAVQERLEAAVTGLARRAIQLTGIPDLCLAGGVSLNCVANGKLARAGFTRQVHIPPPNNDAGSALGAALWVAREQEADPRFVLKHPCWGPGYTDAEICHRLDELSIPYQRYENIEANVAHHLAQGRTVAWFQGRMEMGPRALGARSLLGDPRNPEMHRRLNDIKGREQWRPLAPAILKEAVDEYLIDAQSSRFMTAACAVRPNKRAVIPSVVHTDGSARPQVVSRGSCPDRYYDLIQEFGNLTGVPVIVNTSFNTKGEPIVCSIDDAVRTFYASTIDELAIGPALVVKK